jgi:hypothetical protein
VQFVMHCGTYSLSTQWAPAAGSSARAMRVETPWSRFAIEMMDARCR